MPSTLTDKVAVISGGSRGIGRAIARKLAQEGCDCLLAARNEDKLRAAAELIARESGRRVEICPTDLRTLAGCEVVFEKMLLLGAKSQAKRHSSCKPQTHAQSLSIRVCV